jgi:hypothetical protein
MTLKSPIFWSQDLTKEMKTMTNTKRSIFGRAFAVIGAASAAAAAIEGGRRPQASDLTTLGINPASFPAPYRRG